VCILTFFRLGLPDANTSIDNSYLNIRWHCVEDNPASQASISRKISVWTVFAFMCDYKATPITHVIN
jgi:hypothetical protein